MKKTLFILSIFFVLFSFYPTLFEIYQSKNLPKERAFELVHNYVFDYNFYLSRIRQGNEGHWLVSEKYYNEPHAPSLFQILYLYLGKLGGLVKFVGLELSPPIIYHLARLLMGFMLLMIIGKLIQTLFGGWWQIVAYLLVVTAGSWPILVRVGESYRFATHWGYWSAIDSLQRITFLPHVLAGQIFLLLFIHFFSDKSPKLSLGSARDRLKSLMWGAIGFVAGIIFPPVLVTVYAIFGVMTVLELLFLGRSNLRRGSTSLRILFIIFSFPSLIYAQIMFKVEPWNALVLFDIQHRSILPYKEFALALGPILPLGLAGLIWALKKKDKKFFPFVVWILALGILFFIFERVPQQSPTRFTQMLINVPLGVLTTYLFYSIWNFYDKYKRSHAFVIRSGVWTIIVMIILMGLGVMVSMVGWLTDQAEAKRQGTWLYPAGAQLVYPLKDFMDAIEFLRLNTSTNDAVLTYEAAGNYIPAYAGNYVYLGHANTPNEDGKLNVASKFYKGEMKSDEAKDFLNKENIKYIYFGPQEKDMGAIADLSSAYPFLESIYSNTKVSVYQFRQPNPIQDR